ncbi:MAG TPA: hypothetical protein VJU61_13495, partial [Polyangiaceae bacterium]|nr:hypothetical protein [Polyangiaceae bacterium]
MRVERLAAAFVLAGLVGCSGSGTPPVATVAAPTGQGPDSAELEAADLTPAPAPENIVLLATLRTPGVTVDTLMGWTGLGINWRDLAQSGAAAQLFPVLDLEAPIDAIATLDPKSKNRPRLLFAGSIGLTSRQGAVDAFKSLDLAVEPAGPGVLAVHPNAKSICFIAPALGKAKVRLVCGEDREAVELLSPYLTRGIPSDSTGDAALHVELRAEPAWRQYGDKAALLKLGIPVLLGEVSIGNADFDAALREAAGVGVDELTDTLADLKDLRLDLRLTDSPAELALTLGMDLRSSRSWLAGAFADAESRASVAPDSFWNLPIGASEAAYQASSKPDSMRRGLEILERLAETGLGQLGASAAIRRDWPLALREALSVTGPMVSARGAVPARQLPATPDAREKLRASLGYLLLGGDDEGNRYAELLERSFKLYEDTALRKGLAQRYGLSASKLPKLQSKKGPARLPESRVYELSLPPAAFADLVGDESDRAKLGSAPLPIVLVSCRAGQRTWIAVSSFAALNEELLSGALTPSGPEATLASRAGLESLRQERANLAGFWTLAGLEQGVGDRSGLKKALTTFGTSDVP